METVSSHLKIQMLHLQKPLKPLHVHFAHLILKFLESILDMEFGLRRKT